jgi:release factor glutamine methyltransferase
MTEEEQMLSEILGCRRVDLYLQRYTLSAEQKERFDDMLRRRNGGEPLQYIIGHTDFMGLKTFVDRRVLIPRPETELLVEDALALMNDIYAGRTLNVLDAGTGSGNIAIAIAKNFPDCRVTAIDSSQTALELAMKNAAFHRLSQRIDFLYRDMNDFLSGEHNAIGRFDVILSNPPYIKRADLAALPKDVRQEPAGALDGGKDGLDFIRVLLALSPNVLADEGILIFEIGDGQSEAVYHCFEYTNTFRHIEFKKDYRNTNRYAICRLAPAEALLSKKSKGAYGKIGH